MREEKDSIDCHSSLMYGRLHMPPDVINDFTQGALNGAKQAMDDFIAKNFKDITVNSKIVVGSVADEILETTDDEKADIIIMGTRGHKGMDRILFGSVVDKVVKNSTVPVMTIRP